MKKLSPFILFISISASASPFDSYSCQEAKKAHQDCKKQNCTSSDTHQSCTLEKCGQTWSEVEYHCHD